MQVNKVLSPVEKLKFDSKFPANLLKLSNEFVKLFNIPQDYE